MIKGYIFDMDGVLCDSETIIADAAVRLFKERYNTDVKAEDFHPFVGSGEERYLCGVAELNGLTLTMPDDKNELYRLYADCAKGELQPIPGVKEFLVAASQKGIKLAVATSADEFKMHVNLRELGLEESLFDALVNGLDIEHKKPAPDIFLLAAKQLGLDPADCIVFEDAINGVQAAIAAGSQCIGITSMFSAEKLIGAGATDALPDFIDMDLSLPA